MVLQAATTSPITTNELRGDQARRLRLRTFWDRFQVHGAWVRELVAPLRDELDGQLQTIPRDREFDFDLDTLYVHSHDGFPSVDLIDEPDLFVALAILDDRRNDGPRTPINLDDLALLVHQGLSELSDGQLGCSASTLRRRFSTLDSRAPWLAAALLPGFVRTARAIPGQPVPTAGGCSYSSTVFGDIDLDEELSEQVLAFPTQRWVLVDVRQNLVFVQGHTEPYRCREGIEIALACEVLNRWRLGGNTDPMKSRVLRGEMATVYAEFFGRKRSVSSRTLCRRFRQLAESPHPLREHLVTVPHCAGGYMLDLQWADGAAPQYPAPVWPTRRAAA